MKKKTLTMRNVILKHPSYSLLCKGCMNEEFGYALILLAMEVVSFLLDLLGGSHWGYLLASFLLSVLILETALDAYLNRRSGIKSEAQQLAVEIVFSVLQLIISCYCLVRTLSGIKTYYSSSVFPLAYAIISAVFTFSHSSSDTPPDVDNFELNEVTVDAICTPVDNVGPLDQSPVSVPTSDDKVDPSDPTLVSFVPVDPSDPTLASPVPTGDAEVDPLDSKLASSVPSTSDAIVDPSDPTPASSVPTSDAIVDPSEPPPASSVPTGDAEVDPLDPTLPSSVPPSDAEVDPLDPTLYSAPTSSVSVPQANTLRQRNKQSAFKKIVFKVELGNDKAKTKAMKTVSGIPGVDWIQTDMKEKKLTVIGDVDPADVAIKLRKQCHTEIISISPANEENIPFAVPPRPPWN